LPEVLTVINVQLHHICLEFVQLFGERDCCIKFLNDVCGCG